jgi:hypothetical protein
MEYRYPLFVRLVIAISVLALGLMAGCAAKKWVVVEEPKGVTLEYRMVEGEVLKYKVEQHSDQTMEPMGMAMETAGHKTIEFSVAPRGLVGGAYELEITIESMDAGMSSMQGEVSADVEPVLGQSFSMSLSQLGKELDVSEAEPIHYGLGPQGTQSIMSDFMAVFPDLPGTPVNIGDSWTSQDTITIAQEGMDIEIISESVNTLVGVEPFAGLECAKVTAEVSGTVKGGGEREGAAISFDGTVGGTETWYFAPDQGLFVELSSDLFTRSTINVSGPQEMSFPMTDKMRITTTLIQ